MFFSAVAIATLFYTISATPISQSLQALTLPRASTLNATDPILAPFPAGGWRYHVPNSPTFMFVKHSPHGEIMPVETALKIVGSAFGELTFLIHGCNKGDDPVNNSHEWDDDYGGLVIEAYQWSPIQGPFTYRMLYDTLFGLLIYLRDFDPPVECEVLIHQRVGTPSAYLAGMGFLSFAQTDHLRSTKARGASIPSTGLELLRTCGETRNHIDS